MFSEIIIHINGSKSLTIENYKNILDYKEDFISIQGKKENMKISGKDFRINYFTQDSMRISGMVEKIEIQHSCKTIDRR